MLRLLTFGGLSLESGEALVAPRPKPQRLALLAVLAAAGELGCSRERLVSLFWPEADDERGRHSLRQMLYALRQETGEDLVEAASSLFLNPKAISSDLAEFHAALAAGDRRRAGALYRGAFLDGFYLSGSPEFERWVEQERSRLAESAVAALVALAGEAAAARNHDEAARWWRSLTQIDPLSARYALNYARALVASGERPKALAFIHAHEALVRRELEVEPDPDVRRLEAELRAVRGPEIAAIAQAIGGPSPAAEAGPVAANPEVPAAGEPRSRSGWTARRRALFGSIAVMTILVVLGAQWALSGWGASPSSGVAIRGFTTSPIASRFYEEGLLAYYAGDWEMARRLMTAALREDSTFAMAAYVSALLEPGYAYEARQHALRLAQRAPERERLTITADLLRLDHDPGALAAAEELTSRYPDQARAFDILAAVREAAGDWAGSVAARERAIALHETTAGSPQEGCRVCESYGQLAEAYYWWDSLPAVERTARRLLDVDPSQWWPWALLAGVAARRGDSTAAFRHMRRYVAMPRTRIPKGDELTLLLVLERYDQVEREVQPLLASSRPDEAGLGRWMLTIALRNQGRLKEASHLHTHGQLPGSAPPAVPVDADYVNEAVLALETGEPRRAAEAFATRGQMGLPRAPGLYARWVAWHNTLAGTAHAAAGDTAAVRRLADTVRYWGERSLFGRDRRAHHFLRGLLLAASGKDGEAVGEYRAAVHSYTFGYTRVNFELARSLLRLGRPAEAVEVLQPALRGAIDAGNLYVTRTELHELLADAFSRLEQRDSTAAHARAVVQAWARADQRLLQRREAAQRLLAKAERLRE